MESEAPFTWPVKTAAEVETEGLFYGVIGGSLCTKGVLDVC